MSTTTSFPTLMSIFFLFFKISTYFPTPNSKFWKKQKKIDINVGKLVVVDICDVIICFSFSSRYLQTYNPGFNFFHFFKILSWKLEILKKIHRGNKVSELHDSWRSSIKNSYSIDEKTWKKSLGALCLSFSFSPTQEQGGTRNEFGIDN